MTEMPDLLQAAFPETVFNAPNIWNTWVLRNLHAVVLFCWMIWKSLDCLRQMKRVFLDKFLEAKCREKPGTWSPGSNQRHLPIGRLRFIDSAKSSTTKQRVHWCRRKPFQINTETTEDVDKGHSKECRSFDVDLRCNTFKIPFWAVYTQAYGGAGTWTRSCQTRTPSIFFFGPRKRGVRPHPPNPPWLRAWEHEVTETGRELKRAREGGKKYFGDREYGRGKWKKENCMFRKKK